MITVRESTVDDLAAMAAFSDESEHAPRWSGKAWRDVVLTKTVLVAEGAGGVCGVIVAGIVFDVAEIENVVVAEAMQRHGIARRLVNELAILVRGRGAATMQLEVNERNVVAVALYRSMGFREQGRRARYYGGVDDAVLMTMKLANLAGS